MCGADARANGWTDVRSRDYQNFFGYTGNLFFFFTHGSPLVFRARENCTTKTPNIDIDFRI